MEPLLNFLGKEGRYEKHHCLFCNFNYIKDIVLISLNLSHPIHEMSRMLLQRCYYRVFLLVLLLSSTFLVFPLVDLFTHQLSLYVQGTIVDTVENIGKECDSILTLVRQGKSGDLRALIAMS